MVREGPNTGGAKTPEGIKLLWSEIVRDFSTHVFRVTVHHNGLQLSGEVAGVSASDMTLQSSGKALSIDRWSVMPTKDAPVTYLAITSKRKRLLNKLRS